MATEIVWNQATVAEWRRLIDRANHATLPQSWAYAQAMAAADRQFPHFGVIREGGIEIGCILALERRAPGGFSRISLHRGPLWIETPPEDRQRDVLGALRRKWPRRPWRRMSFIAEMPAGAASHRLLEESGFRRAGDGYRSILMDLARPEAARRASLRASTRQRLGQGERSGLAVEIDRHGKAAFPWLLQRYEIEKKLKGYRGPSVTLAIQMMRSARPYDEGLVLLARQGEEPVAGIFVLRHGASATYQIGWTGAEGRRLQATYLLLWRAMETLAGEGVRHFDLGGINPDHAAGVTEFKRGFGGDEYELIGTYT